MVENVGRCANHPLHRVEIAHEITHQHFHRGPGQQFANRLNGRHHVAGCAIGQIVAIHHRDDYVLQAQVFRGLRHVPRLVYVQRLGRALRDRAITASSRADVPANHEGGRIAGKTLEQVRATGFLAHGVQMLVAHQRLDFV